MKVDIPASWAARGYGIPDVCGRHGRPAVAVARVDVLVHPLWTWVFLFIGVFTFFLVRLFTGKRLVLPEWPFCELCLHQRKRRLVASAVLVLLGLAAIAISIGVQDSRPDLAWSGVLLVVAGVIVFAFTSWTEIARVKADYDLEWVTVNGAHPEFEAKFASYLTEQHADGLVRFPS